MRKGLTLIEIIASTVILGIVVAGLAAMFVMGKRYIRHSRFRMTSSEVAKYFLDPLQMEVNQSQWSANCLGSNTGCPDEPLDFGDGAVYNPLIFETGSLESLRYVNLTINWTEVSPES